MVVGKLIKQIHYNAISSGEICCSRCKVFHPRNEGSYVPYNSGKNQKWICNRCQNKELK